MAATAVENDIDDFIRNQKVKLQQEREYLADSERGDGGGRKQWDRNGDTNIPVAEQKENTEPKEEGLPLDNSKALARKEELRRERQQEYQAYKEQKQDKGRGAQDAEESPRKDGIDYSEWEKSFQEEKRREYNEYLQKPKHRRTPTPPQRGMRFGEYEDFKKKVDQQRKNEYRRELQKQRKEHATQLVKAPTPPQLGMKFGEFEDFKKRVEQQRKDEYREELEKQQRDQAFHKAARKGQGTSIADMSGRPPKHRGSERDRERWRKERNRRDERDRRIESNRVEEFKKMLSLNRIDSDLQSQTGKVQDTERKAGDQLGEGRAERSEIRPPYIPIEPAPLIPPLNLDISVSHRDYPAPREEDYTARQEPYAPPKGRDRRDELSEAEKRRHRFKEERSKDYNDYLQKRDEYEKTRQDYDRNRPPSPRGGRAPPSRAPAQPARQGPNSQGGGLFSNLGQHEDEIRKLNEERKKEYQQLLAEREVRTRGNVRPEAEEYGATLKGIRQHDSAELKKQKVRNEEYNEYLKQKREQEKHRFDDKKPRHGVQDGRPSSEPNKQRKDDDIFATLPGIHYNGSAQRGRPPAGPKSGWQTPTYDDILDRKRREEAQYRRDDPGMRAYASEGAINNVGTDDDRYRRLDLEYDDKKVRFRDQRAQQNSILEDDNWLATGKDQEYRQLRSPEGPRHQSQPPPSRYREADQEAPREDMANASYYATLPVGHVDRESAKRRRKEKYKEELQLQMREQEAAKRRERVEDLKVNASGYLDPEHTVHRQKGLGDPSISPRNRNIRSPEVKPYHTKIVSSPRGGFGGDYDGGGGYPRRERGRPREREYRGGGGGLGGGGLDGGILDRGFEGILTENRRTLSNNIPPGLAYQPSTYVTGGGSSGLNQAYSSIDEAYHFYGLKNPLEPEPSAGGVVPTLHFDRLDDYGGRRSPRVTFDDTVRARDRSRERISPYQFPSDEEIRSRSRSDKLSYKEELERQVQEKRLQKQREREEKERYERKLEDDIKNYNPFGRGGGGAPLKDQHGNVTADLRHLRGQSTYRGSSRSPPPRESPRFRSPSSPKDDLYNVPPVQTDASGDPTYARGGHGIFGNPRTDEEKNQADRYKDDLRRQIEDKKRREQEDREKQRQEDEKENRRIEEQRQRIQQEFEEEQRKKREKEEDARRKNEELRQEAEARKKDQDRKKREDDERKQRERREQEERDRHERQQQQLQQQYQRETNSPPIPALKSKMATTDGEPSELNYTTIVRDTPDRDSPRPVTSEDTHRKSPPIPALRKEEPPQERRPPPEPVARANSSDVLKELASMRKQLQSERRRVENALENQKNEPDVFDPRMVQRPPPKEIDVFERAKMGAPTVPIRTADNANPRNLQEFNELKYKNDTESRRAFRNMFPDAPITNSALETQQDAMLRHQEDTLRNLKERKTNARGQGSVAPPIGARQGTVSPRSLLQSNSAFIDVDGLNHFPDDFEDLPRRNESARYRRRERITVSPRPESQPVNPMTLGSVTSLDVDRIQRKNDARLRRLHQMNADEVSVGDPDDILDRFMAKQRYNRPPSGQTLQDDTWLRPGSKAI